MLRVAVYNNSGSLISAGSILRQTGVIRPQQLPTVALASAASTTTDAVFGVAIDSIPNGSVGSAIIAGIVTADTTAFSIDDLVYLSDTPGAISTTPGTTGSIVGVVIISAVAGCILLKETKNPDKCTVPSSSGATGIQGATGISGGGAGSGATGIQGATGISGGGTGLQGETGLQGATGISGGGTGLQGATGAQGVTGISGGGTGLQGATGTQGSSILVLRYVGATAVPIDGTLYLETGGDFAVSATGDRLATDSTLFGIAIEVNASDASNTYDVEVISDPTSSSTVLATLNLPTGVRGISSTSFIANIAANTEIGVRLVRSSGSTSSTFTECNVLIYLSTPGYGVTGLQVVGATGIQGSTGVQGLTGLQGVTGIQGITGVSYQGETGLLAQGVTGVQGITGILGMDGHTGIQGTTGIQGVTGIQNTSIALLRYVSGIEVPIEGSLFLQTGADFATSSTGDRLATDSSLFAISVEVDVADPSNDFDVEIVTDPTSSPTVIATLSLPSGSRGVSSTGYAVNLPANTEIGARLVRTSGSTESAFADCNVLVYLSTPGYGVTGLQVIGATGIQGQTGVQGATGVGPQGATGIIGQTGIQGVTGVSVQGNTGIAGDTGLQGIQGIQGSTGIQGATGIAVQGATGLQGQTGIQGITGLTLQGETGIQGSTGLQGLTGISVQGETGIQGATGVQGETGISVQGATGIQGTTGIRGITGASLQGETGILTQGETGIQGVTGLIGSTGIQGITGLQGTTGIIDIAVDVHMALGGRFSALGALPVTNLGSELISRTKTLSIFRARRGTAGSSGTTTIQLEINGSAVAGATLSWTSADPDYTLQSVTISEAVNAGDRISFRVTSTETGSARDIFAEAN